MVAGISIQPNTDSSKSVGKLNVLENVLKKKSKLRLFVQMLIGAAVDGLDS